MNTDERDQFAERWLDEALARYNDAEPRPGLESRILANLAAAPEPRAHRWHWLWIPVTCAALVGMTVGIAAVRQSRTGPFVPRMSQPTAAAGVQTAGRSNTETPVPKPAKAALRGHRIATTAQVRPAVARAEPRLQEFPSGAPLSGQEKLLLMYATATPPQELLTIIQLQNRREQELQRLSDTKGLTDQPAAGQDNRNTTPPLNRADSDTRGVR